MEESYEDWLSNIGLFKGEVYEQQEINDVILKTLYRMQCQINEHPDDIQKIKKIYSQGIKNPIEITQRALEDLRGVEEVRVDWGQCKPTYQQVEYTVRGGDEQEIAGILLDTLPLLYATKGSVRKEVKCMFGLTHTRCFSRPKEVKK